MQCSVYSIKSSSFSIRVCHPVCRMFPLYLSVSLFLFLCLSVCLSLSVYLSLCLSFSLSLSLSVWICLSVCVFLSLSGCLFLSLFAPCVSVSLSFLSLSPPFLCLVLFSSLTPTNNRYSLKTPIHIYDRDRYK